MSNEPTELVRVMKIKLQGLPISVQMKSWRPQGQSIFNNEEVVFWLQEACEKIISENSIEPHAVKSISCGSIEVDFGIYEVLSIKLSKLKIESLSGKSYQLEEFSNLNLIQI